MSEINIEEAFKKNLISIKETNPRLYQRLLGEIKTPATLGQFAQIVCHRDFENFHTKEGTILLTSKLISTITFIYTALRNVGETLTLFDIHGIKLPFEMKKKEILVNFFRTTTPFPDTPEEIIREIEWIMKE